MTAEHLRPFVMQVCAATGVTAVAKKSGLTTTDWHQASHLSRSDWLKLWGNTCGRAYDSGVLTGSGRLSKADRARFAAIYRKTLHQMVYSGDIAIIP
jgi:hypothetical protein